MTCTEFRDHVEVLLDGLLPPEEAERHEAHRDACDDCAAQWAEAVRFRDLLAREGRAALGAWEARRLSIRAASMAPGEDAAEPVPVLRPRFGFVRYVAAAALIAAAAFYGSGLLGDSGPVRLAYGAETDLVPGSEATFGHDCRLLVEDRAVTVTLEKGPASERGPSDILRMERGVALFRVHPEHALGVATPQGTARAVGATFVVDVRSDGAVSVDVVTGRVRLERDDELLVARTGERVEVDSGGRAHFVSRARVDELELEADRRAEENEALRTELARAEEQLDAYVHAAPAVEDDAASGGELPLEELGRVLRVMIDREVGRRDQRRNDAVAFFLSNASRIREEFGVSDPMRAIESPAFVGAVADGFLAALAPDASEDAVAAAAADLRVACARVEAELVGEPLPTESAASRQRALVDIVRSVDRNLGAAAAAEIVRSFRGSWDGPRPWVQALDDRVEARMVGFRQKSLSLDEEQTARLADLIRVYIAQSVTMQDQVAAALPADEVEPVLFPSRGPFGRGFPRRPSGDDSSASEPAPPEPSDAEVVAKRLREIDARLHLAEPRARFERALWNLLNEEQREKELRFGARLLTFRPPQGE